VAGTGRVDGDQVTSTLESDSLGFAAAYARLRSAQKTPVGTPAYSRYFNRPLGRVLAACAYQLRLTPDQVSYISAAFTFAAITLLAVLPVSWWLGALVCLGLVLGYALDSADGQLARLRGGGSTLGEWLDHMIDSAKITSLHLAVLIAAFRGFHLPSPAWLLVPIAFTVLSAVHFFGMILVDHLVRLYQSDHDVPTPRSWTADNPVLMVLKVPLDYGFLCLSFALLGATNIFFGLYTVLTLGSAGYLTLALRKWRSDIAGLEEPPSV
jgi:phosphatidylglycerophosphate synthase